MRDTIIIGVACLVAIGAGAWLFLSGEKEALSPSAPAGPVAFAILYEGEYAGSVTERTNYRIKTAAELAELWSLIYGTDGPTLPSIDFEKEEVLAVFDGTHASGGYDVRVVSIEDGALNRIVRLERSAPGDTCVTTSAITSPFLLLAAPKTILPLTREETTTTVACD